MEAQFVISKSLGDAIINYLAEKPYKETAGMIMGLQQLQPIPQMPAPTNQVKLPEVDVNAE